MIKTDRQVTETVSVPKALLLQLLTRKRWGKLELLSEGEWDNDMETTVVRFRVTRNELVWRPNK